MHGLYNIKKINLEVINLSYSSELANDTHNTLEMSGWKKLSTKIGSKELKMTTEASLKQSYN